MASQLKLIIVDLKQNRNIVVRGIVCDNATTNSAAVKYLNHEGKDLSMSSKVLCHVEDHVTLLRCVCHTLDLVLEDYCKEFGLKPII